MVVIVIENGKEMENGKLILMPVSEADADEETGVGGVVMVWLMEMGSVVVALKLALSLVVALSVPLADATSVVLAEALLVEVAVFVSVSRMEDNSLESWLNMFVVPAEEVPVVVDAVFVAEADAESVVDAPKAVDVAPGRLID